jgi:acetyl esterase/lipase
VPGNPSVRVRIHRPHNAGAAVPCLYAIHGGGYIVGSIDDEDVRLDEWCHETPYPGAIEDCYVGLKWTYDNHERLGIARDKIGVVGSSAGGESRRLERSSIGVRFDRNGRRLPRRLGRQLARLR